MKAIKISDEMYKRLMELSNDTQTPVATLASRLIEEGFKHARVVEETRTVSVLYLGEEK